jgi:hypothetical protein
MLSMVVMLLGCGSSPEVSDPAQPEAPGSEPDAATDDTEPEKAQVVRIMSFNIKHGEVSSLEDIAGVIRWCSAPRASRGR